MPAVRLVSRGPHIVANRVQAVNRGQALCCLPHGGNCGLSAKRISPVADRQHGFRMRGKPPEARARRADPWPRNSQPAHRRARHEDCLSRLCQRHQRRHDAGGTGRRRRGLGRAQRRHRLAWDCRACGSLATAVKKKGFRATQITVEHEPEHKHRHLHHITAMIDGSSLTPRQKELAHRIFRRLAEAEAKVHGSTIEKVHFHEVGAVDSIADIVGAAIGWDLLGVERIVASPVPTGTGFVEIAHGDARFPRRPRPSCSRASRWPNRALQCELTTPTGAAILATLVDAYGPLPAMTIERIGYGAGQKDLEEQANCCGCWWARSTDAAGGEQLWVLETNLDELSGELIGHAIGRLWEAGGAGRLHHGHPDEEEPAGREAQRAGCRGRTSRRLEAILFRETTTLGVPPLAARASQAATRAASSRNAAGARRRRAGLARRQAIAVLARVRIVPAGGRCAPGAAASGL